MIVDGHLHKWLSPAPLHAWFIRALIALAVLLEASAAAAAPPQRCEMHVARVSVGADGVVSWSDAPLGPLMPVCRLAQDWVDESVSPPVLVPGALCASYLSVLETAYLSGRPIALTRATGGRSACSADLRGASELTLQ